MSEQKTNLPIEYQSVMSMIQKEDSIRKGITAQKDKILVSAGEEFLSWEQKKQEQFLERTILIIAKDENLTQCFNSLEGKLSIIEAVEKAVSTGLQIGGKHAYLVPQQRQKNGKWVTEVRFSIRDVGYYALLCGGKKPIFKDLRWKIIHAKDECKVNAGTGEVDHIESMDDDKGEFKGCWVQIVKLNGQKEVYLFNKTKINQWRESSKLYQKSVENKKENDSIWVKWYEEMALQACIRHACDKYEKARDLLSSSYYDDEQSETSEKSTVESINDALNEKQPEGPEIKQAEKVENDSEAENEEQEADLF